MATVHLPNVTYAGAVEDGVNTFHGVQYSAPYQRFKKPTPPIHNGETLDASCWGAVCPQLPSRLELVMGPMPADAGSQDERSCGVLSIYVPYGKGQTQSGLPVIVFVHGGAFLSGSSQISQYDGKRLAQDANAVVVTINYRLGIFGFYPIEGGEEFSAGTADVIAAFTWLRENISYFGGDPNNITGTGQSAGAFHIRCLLDFRPDLLDRAILQSCPDATIDPTKHEQVRKIISENLPAGTTLESATTQQLLEAQRIVCTTMPGHIPPFWPNITNAKYQTSAKPKEILICWTKDDGTVFARLGGADIKTQGVQFKENIFSLPSQSHGKRWSSQGHNVSFYEFVWAPTDFDLGATHCIDLPLIFGHRDGWSKSPMLGKTSWDEWESAGRDIRKSWGAFARDGIHPEETIALQPIVIS